MSDFAPLRRRKALLGARPRADRVLLADARCPDVTRDGGGAGVVLGIGDVHSELISSPIIDQRSGVASSTVKGASNLQLAPGRTGRKWVELEVRRSTCVWPWPELARQAGADCRAVRPCAPRARNSKSVCVVPGGTARQLPPAGRERTRSRCASRDARDAPNWYLRPEDHPVGCLRRCRYRTSIHVT